MKIYYIANARMPTEKAHGIQLAKMCEAFAGKGIDVELIVPKKKNSIRESVHDFYGLTHTFTIRKLPFLDFGTSSLGFNVSALSFAFSYFFYLLFKGIRREKAIIYTIDLDQFSFFLIPLLGLPFFIELHDAKKRDIGYAFFLRRAHGVVAINRLVGESIEKNFGFPASKILVHPNGVDVDFFHTLLNQEEARQKLELAPDSRVVLYAGSFQLWKGLETLINAARVTPDILFYCVGGSCEELMRASDARDLPGNIQCIGLRPYSEMPLWMAAADILVALGTHKNDYSYYHTSPMKLFEYMVSERPIVAAATPANQEIVHEEDVFFYTPDDPRDLCEKINEALASPVRSEEKVRSALMRVRQFSWEKRAADVLHLLCA